MPDFYPFRHSLSPPFSSTLINLLFFLNLFCFSFPQLRETSKGGRKFTENSPSTWPNRTTSLQVQGGKFTHSVHSRGKIPKHAQSAFGKEVWMWKKLKEAVYVVKLASIKMSDTETIMYYVMWYITYYGSGFLRRIWMFSCSQRIWRKIFSCDENYYHYEGITLVASSLSLIS